MYIQIIIKVQVDYNENLLSKFIFHQDQNNNNITTVEKYNIHYNNGNTY